MSSYTTELPKESDIEKLLIRWKRLLIPLIH